MGSRSRLGAISYSHTSGTNPRDTLTVPSRQPPQAPKVAIITLPANQLYGCFTGQGASPDQPPARTTADLPGRGKQAPTSHPRQLLPASQAGASLCPRPHPATARRLNNRGCACSVWISSLADHESFEGSGIHTPPNCPRSLTSSARGDNYADTGGCR